MMHTFDDMDRLFEQMRRSMWNPRGEWHDGHADANLTVEPSDDGYVVHVDVPGFEKSELDVHFEDDVLTITGTHEVSDDTRARARRVHERVTVPAEVLVDEITASYSNGVLEVHLPTEEAPAARTEIDIE